MADNVAITAGSGTSIAADEVTDGTLGSVKVQFVKVMDGTLDSTNKLTVNSSGQVTALLASSPVLQGSATITRPADTTAYAVGDAVANSTTAGSVTPMQFTVGRANGALVRVIGLRLTTALTTITNGSFKLHLFTTSPTPAAGDNAAFSMANAANYIGYILVALDTVFTDGAAGFSAPVDLPATLGGADNKLYGLLEARGAYTPASGQVLTLTLTVVPG